MATQSQPILPTASSLAQTSGVSLANPDAIAIVDAAIASRRSCRHFLPTPVPREVIRDILNVAARAATGHNSQPWKVHVLTGTRLKEFVSGALQEFADPTKVKSHFEQSDVYPTQWIPPYIDRRRATGYKLYSALGIQRGDHARMNAQMLKNFEFFGAPVGLIFVMDKVMERGILDVGMFMQNVMVAARARGLDTCAQAAFAIIHKAVRELLELREDERVVCGMALGYAAADAPANSFQTDREPAESFAKFYD